MCYVLSLSWTLYPDVDIFAGDAGGGGNITISALSANNDDDLGNVNIDADEGVWTLIPMMLPLILKV